jgi:secondary thiamine-phosphate synthase enzyme
MNIEIEVRSTKRSELIDITPQIRDAVHECGIQSGICMLSIPHTTAGLVVNENWDPTVQEDLLSTLERLVPWRADYAHSEGNAAAHIKSCLVGTSESLHVDGGELSLGRWQGILLAEFDGPRRRRVLVRVIADTEK